MIYLLIIPAILLIYLLLRIAVVIHLIYVYSKAIKELPTISTEDYYFLQDRKLDEGICHYLNYQWYDLPLITDWVDKYGPNPKKAFWYNCPMHCYNDNLKIKEALQLRRNRLIYVLKRLTIFK